ncbi:MAG: polyisoprenoid-binding protein, partial [Mesorhizobium sp.]
MVARIFGFAAVAACLALPVFAAVALSDAAGSYTISPAGSS